MFSIFLLGFFLIHFLFNISLAKILTQSNLQSRPSPVKNHLSSATCFPNIWNCFPYIWNFLLATTSHKRLWPLPEVKLWNSVLFLNSCKWPLDKNWMIHVSCCLKCHGNKIFVFYFMHSNVLIIIMLFFLEQNCVRALELSVRTFWRHWLFTQKKCDRFSHIFTCFYKFICHIVITY